MTNYELLKDNVIDNKKPFIAYDVETTGIMNGNDNRITQIALAKYLYNHEKGVCEMQDSLFR